MTRPSTTDLMREVRALAAQDPDHVDEGERRDAWPVKGTLTWNVNWRVDNKGQRIPDSGCIIGRAVERMGFHPADHLRDADAHSLLYAVFGAEEVYPSDLAWLMEVQGWQDEGYSWAEAVRRADMPPDDDEETD